jgi:sterol desaturase/sphingolipid hydroxylase (fatty acid hydroxylase superfamily)
MITALEIFFELLVFQHATSKQVSKKFGLSCTRVQNQTKTRSNDIEERDVDDLQFGKRNKRGDWAPTAALEPAPLWSRPLKLGVLLRWFISYLWPWNTLYMALTLAYWYWVLPDMATLKTLDWAWALRLYAVNAAAIFVFYGAFEYQLYVRRNQDYRFKYNGKFPADQPSDVFWFKSQNIDNFLRSFCVSIPLWTVVEVLFLWCYANGYVPWLTWADKPLYLGALLLLTPAIHEAHFFCIHRLIHTPLLYKWVHSIHHNSVNPTPWSSLSMHPVEGFLYHAVALWHLVIPSNPIVALFQLHMAGFGALNGHIGFDQVELGEELAFDSHAYAHYLHHKHFEVNYGGDQLIPLDIWFGTWHDGTAAGEARMQARFAKKRERMNAQ